MADPIQLDAAAALVGKSEVTLRRLIKAGKIAFHKEKTPTGFIYQVDPEVVLAYYNKRESDISAASQAVEDIESAPKGAPVPMPAESAVSPAYWQKRAEIYEERFNHEVQNHSQTREELGVWRGRAAQAQDMIVKLLPAPGEVQVQTEETAKKNDSPVLIAALTTVIILIIVVAGGVAAYFAFFAR